MNGAIDQKIREDLTAILERLGVAVSTEISLEIPRNPDHGDLSTNIALLEAKSAERPPRKLAEAVLKDFPLDEDVEAVEVAGPGFINFRLTAGYFYRQLSQVLAGGLSVCPESDAPVGRASEPHAPVGRASEPDQNINDGRAQSPDLRAGDVHAVHPVHSVHSVHPNPPRWLFEFVSANPTGPLNIVSARAASVGSTLVKVFRRMGYDARSEYYVNDAGRQIKLLGASVRARIAQILSGAKTADIPEDGYHGEYVLDLAQDWLKDNDSEKIPDDAALGQWAAGRIRQGQEASLRSFRVEFNNWQRESDLYAEGRAQRVIDVLSQRGLTYQKDGALFFKASQFGDDEDRVLRKSDGDFTYVVPDIAYHLYKRERGFDTAVDLLGPDHHGYIQRMEAALKGLGVPDGFLKALLIQQVNLKRDGQEVKMSKRAGVGVTLDELVEEVGVDAARYFFLLRRITSPLDFDIDLAMRHSDENPVYYVQYAHARICSILRQPQALESTLAADLSLLTEPEELGALRAMARFPWTLSAIVRGVDPHPLTAYLTDLAKSFHQFYTRHRVITDDAGLTAARLALCRGVAAMLKDGLNLMGVSAPEKM